MMEQEKGTWIPDDGTIITALDYFFLGFLLLLSVVLLFAVDLILSDTGKTKQELNSLFLASSWH